MAFTMHELYLFQELLRLMYNANNQ